MGVIAIDWLILTYNGILSFLEGVITSNTPIANLGKRLLLAFYGVFILLFSFLVFGLPWMISIRTGVSVLIILAFLIIILEIVYMIREQDR